MKFFFYIWRLEKEAELLIFTKIHTLLTFMYLGYCYFQKTLLELLCTGRQIKAVTLEIPLDTEQEISVTISDSCLATSLDVSVPFSTVKKPVSVTEVGGFL